MKEKIVRCLKCHEQFSGRQKSTLLGLRKYQCPHCSSEVILDLRPSHRGLYWFGAVFLGLGSIAYIMQGQIPIPGLLGVLSVWGLVVDRQKRREMEDVEQIVFRSGRGGGSP